MTSCLLVILLDSSDSSYILMMIAGGAIGIFFFRSMIIDGQKENRIRREKELDAKIKFQPFILEVLKIYPNAKISHISDYMVILETFFVYANKTIGEVELKSSGHGAMSGWAQNTISIIISLYNSDKKYEITKKLEITEQVALNDLVKELMHNQELQKRIIATTY